METKSGAQKLSDFGSQLGESHTATRLDGESMQGENTGQMLGAEKTAKQAMGVVFAVGGINLATGLAITLGLFASGGGVAEGLQFLLVGGAFIGLALWARRDSFPGTLAAFTMFTGYRLVTIAMSGVFDMRSMAFTIAVAGVLGFAVRQTHRSLIARGRRPEMIKPVAVGAGLVVLCVTVAILTGRSAASCGEDGVDCPTDTVDDVEPTDDVPADERAVKSAPIKAPPAKTKPGKAVVEKPGPAKAGDVKPAAIKGKKAAPVATVKGAKGKAAAKNAKGGKATKLGKAKTKAKAAKPGKSKAKTKPN